MTDPDTFTDHFGHELYINDDPDDIVAAQVLTNGAPVSITAERLPEIVTLLYARVHQTRPIIADRAAVDLAEGLSLFDGLIGVSYDSGRVVIRCTSGGEHRALPDEARAAAALLAAYADLAAAEPTPDEVAGLAEILRDLNPVAEDWDDMEIARGLLRRFDIKERTP